MAEFNLYSAPSANAVRGVNRRDPVAGLARFGIVTLLATLSWALAQRQGTHAQGPPVKAQTDMDKAIAFLTEARLQFQNVGDYECRSIKRENVNGVLLPEGEMAMKVRSKPFSVYLHFERPDSDKGMEVCYVEGRNQGKMRVHPAGIKGVLGFWSVDLRDPRVFEKNRHCIAEAGLGNLLESTARYWDMEHRLNKTLVHITDEEIDGHPCTRIETIHPDRNAGPFYGYRCVLWLDKATHLPVGAETYDWPRRGGPDGGDLLESYRFFDLRCNVGLSDDTFNR